MEPKTPSTDLTTPENIVASKDEEASAHCFVGVRKYVSESRFKQIQHKVKDFLLPQQDDLNSSQLGFYSFMLGITGGILSVAYQQALKWLIVLLWKVIPDGLERSGLFRILPEWNYIWVLPTFMGLLIGITSPRIPFTANLPFLLEKLHKKGNITYDVSCKTDLRQHQAFLAHAGNFNGFMSISGGGSTGPEVAILVLMAAVAGYLCRTLSPSTRKRRILTLAGMAAGLSAFFGLPLGGALFVLEVPHREGLEYFESAPFVVLASLTSVIVSAGVQNQSLSGHLNYPELHEFYASDMLLAGVLGLIGGTVAMLFIFLAKKMGDFLEWSDLKSKPMLRAILTGFFLGWAGVLYPQTLFWSEFELQTMIDRGETPLPHLDIQGALGVSVPYPLYHIFGIAFLKMAAILITIAGGWPGGIIFPLFYVGGYLGQAIYLIVPGLNQTLCVMCCMAAVQVAVTRTPWATNVIIQLLHRSFRNSDHHAVSTFPILTTAIYCSLFLTHKYEFFPHQSQKSRTDITYHHLKTDLVELPSLSNTSSSVEELDETQVAL